MNNQYATRCTLHAIGDASRFTFDATVTSLATATARRNLLYICREPSTNPPLFMQNKPNLRNAQINTSSCLTKDYANVRLHGRRENKPKQTQFAAYYCSLKN